jgi:excisionase family DNA binding protein
MIEPPPLAMRLKDFCERMGISRSTFWKYVKAGRINVIRFGGRVLIPAQEVERILAEGVQK